MSTDSPAAILFDELGNPVGVMLDGYVYRLQVETIITDTSGNGPAAVKPPNTAAVAADPALVVAFSPNNPITVSSARPATSTTHSVVGSATNVVLLASNTTRLGATIYNDSSALLYVKLGATASTTDFTIKMFPLGYYEIPYGYTGEIDGIWSSALGHARIDELTP
jgi:hypothetical protein